jgi:hypothetical protein
MKKTISIALISLLIIVVIFLLIFRHMIIGHAFKVSISNKTNKTIEFNIGHVYYSVLNSSVSFIESDLEFHNVYLNREKTIELSDLKFDEIKLEGLSVFRLLFRDEVVADKFIVVKPSLWFQEDNNPKAFKDRPKEIIESLKEHPDLLGDLKVIVNEIEITHGKVDLNSIFDVDARSASVEFKIILKNFDTSKEHIFNENRFLFAKEHLLKLNGFNYLFPNGDQLSFDSLVFRSEKDEVDISNIRFKIKGNSIHPKFKVVSGGINRLSIEGIDLMDLQGLGKVEIDTILVSNVQLNVSENVNKVAPNRQDTVRKAKYFNKLLKKIIVNAFELENINLKYEDVFGDSIASIKNFNLKVSDIILDSGIVQKQMPAFSFNSINSEVDMVKFKSNITGMNISFNEFHFDEEQEILSLNDLNIHDENDTATSFLIDVNSLELSNISLEEYIKNGTFNIGLKLNSPNAIIDIHNTDHKGKSNNKYYKGLAFSNIQVNNGIIQLSAKDKLNLRVEGLRLNTGEVILDSIFNNGRLNFENTSLSYNDLALELPAKNIIASSGILNVTNNDLSLNKLYLRNYVSSKGSSTIEIEKINMSDCDFNSLLTSDKLTLGNIEILKPRIHGTLIPDSHKLNKNHDKNEFQYGLEVDTFTIIDGDLDLELFTKNEHLSVVSGFNVNLNNIDVKHFNNNDWIKDVEWIIKLNSSHVSYNNYSIFCDNLLSHKRNKLFIASGLSVKENNINDSLKRFIIKDFHLNSIKLAGVNYYSFISTKTPIIKSAEIISPKLDIKIDNRNKEPKSVNEDKKKPTIFPVILDELIINEFGLNLEHVTNNSISYLDIEKFDVKYALDGAEDLIKDLKYLDVKDVSYSDTLKNVYVTIENIFYGKSKNIFNVINVKGGNIANKQSIPNHTNFTSSGIKLQDIYVSNTYPAQINMGNIDIDDFLIEIENNGNKESKSTGTHGKILLPEGIESLGINKILSDKIVLNHTKVNDDSSNKTSLYELGLIIDSIRLDSSSLNKNDLSFVKYVALETSKNGFISKDSLYVTNISKVSYNFVDNVLAVDSLSMIPRYEDDMFFKLAKYQTGRLDVKTGSIVCSNFRIDEFIRNGRIHFGGIDIIGLDTRIYRNKTYEIKPGTYKKMPQEAIIGIDKTITIDSLKTHDAFISYKELDKKSIVPGEIFLDSFNLSIYNINNDLKIIDNSSAMIAKLQARLLGKSELDLKVTFPLLSPSNDFWVEGKLKRIEFQDLDNMTQNLVGVTMKRGSGDLVIPLISGNSNHSDGNVLFSYSKLKIELYDREKAKNTKGLTGGMASLLLNDVFIKSNNPGFLGKTRPGEVYFKRDTQKSIVSYIWKSVMSGLMSTMGYNNKEQRQEKRALKRK